MTKLLRFFIFPVNISAGFADQDLLTFGAGDLHVGLVGAEVGFAAAGAEGPATGFTNQRLLAKAALDHLRQTIRESVGWKGLTCAGYAESLLRWFVMQFTRWPAGFCGMFAHLLLTRGTRLAIVPPLFCP